MRARRIPPPLPSPCVHAVHIRDIKPTSHPSASTRDAAVHVRASPWLSPEHPDPERFHLNTLAPLLNAYQKEYGIKLVVFIDFCSLFQKPRDEAQDALFAQGLAALTLIYGHQHTTVWCLTRAPPGTARGYRDRGWCTFEPTVASALKVSLYLLDMGLLEVAPSAVTDFQAEVMNVCDKGSRRPPLTREAFAEVLATKHFTNGSSDHELVVRLYGDFAREALGSAKALTFGSLDWGDAEARQVAAAMPLCPGLLSLNLGSNDKIGDDGVRALAASLPRGLEQLDLSCNEVGTAGASALLAVIPASLRVLNLDGNPCAAGCPVANARTRKAVEQQVRFFFGGEKAAVRAEVKAARSAHRATARNGSTHVDIEGQVCARRLRCTGRPYGLVPDQTPAIAIPLYLITCCRERAWYWRLLDPYRGEWLLSADAPLVEGAPHYERRLRSGVTKHLFRFVEPATGTAAWRVGPTPGEAACTVMTYVTSAMRPTGLEWQVDTGDRDVDDAGFAFAEMGGQADGRRAGA